jgi:hypothetical protein
MHKLMKFITFMLDCIRVVHDWMHMVLQCIETVLQRMASLACTGTARSTVWAKAGGTLG